MKGKAAMAEEDTSATDDKPDEGTSTTEKPDTDATTAEVEGADKPDAVRKALQTERDAAKQARKRAEEAEAKVKEFEDRDKSEQDKLEERASTAEGRATEAEAKLLRLTVGAKKGLPVGLAERLQGADEEAMSKDADRLLKEIKNSGGSVSFDGGARQTAPSGGIDGAIRRAAGRT